MLILFVPGLSSSTRSASDRDVTISREISLHFMTFRDTEIAREISIINVNTRPGRKTVPFVRICPQTAGQEISVSWNHKIITRKIFCELMEAVIERIWPQLGGVCETFWAVTETDGGGGPGAGVWWRYTNNQIIISINTRQTSLLALPTRLVKFRPGKNSVLLWSAAVTITDIARLFNIKTSPASPGISVWSL